MQKGNLVNKYSIALMEGWIRSVKRKIGEKKYKEKIEKRIKIKIKFNG